MAEVGSPKERLQQLNCDKEQMRLKLENLKRKATILIKLAKQHSEVFPGKSDAVFKDLQSYLTEVCLSLKRTYVPNFKLLFFRFRLCRPPLD